MHFSPPPFPLPSPYSYPSSLLSLPLSFPSISASFPRSPPPSSPPPFRHPLDPNHSTCNETRSSSLKASCAVLSAVPIPTRSCRRTEGVDLLPWLRPFLNLPSNRALLEASEHLRDLSPSVAAFLKAERAAGDGNKRRRNQGGGASSCPFGDLGTFIEPVGDRRRHRSPPSLRREQEQHDRAGTRRGDPVRHHRDHREPRHRGSSPSPREASRSRGAADPPPRAHASDQGRALSNYGTQSEVLSEADAEELRALEEWRKEQKQQQQQHSGQRSRSGGSPQPFGRAPPPVAGPQEEDLQGWSSGGHERGSGSYRQGYGEDDRFRDGGYDYGFHRGGDVVPGPPADDGRGRTDWEDGRPRDGGHREMGGYEYSFRHGGGVAFEPPADDRGPPHRGHRDAEDGFYREGGYDSGWGGGRAPALPTDGRGPPPRGHREADEVGRFREGTYREAEDGRFRDGGYRGGQEGGAGLGHNRGQWKEDGRSGKFHMDEPLPGNDRRFYEGGYNNSRPVSPQWRQQREGGRGHNDGHWEKEDIPHLSDYHSGPPSRSIRDGSGYDRTYSEYRRVQEEGAHPPGFRHGDHHHRAGDYREGPGNGYEFPRHPEDIRPAAAHGGAPDSQIGSIGPLQGEDGFPPGFHGDPRRGRLADHWHPQQQQQERWYREEQLPGNSSRNGNGREHYEEYYHPSHSHDYPPTEDPRSVREQRDGKLQIPPHIHGEAATHYGGPPAAAPPHYHDQGDGDRFTHHAAPFDPDGRSLPGQQRQQDWGRHHDDRSSSLGSRAEPYFEEQPLRSTSFRYRE